MNILLLFITSDIKLNSKRRNTTLHGEASADERHIIQVLKNY